MIHFSEDMNTDNINIRFFHIGEAKSGNKIDYSYSFYLGCGALAASIAAMFVSFFSIMCQYLKHSSHEDSRIRRRSFRPVFW